MSKQFAIEWVLIISFLTTYFFIGTLLTGEATPFVVVLLLVLVTWFLVYRSRHEGLENRELIRRMYADLRGARERIAGEQQIAQEETQRRAAAKDKRLARMKRERRAKPMNDPTVNKYADMIEEKVREAEVRQNKSEGTRLEPEGR
jgi:hypothetical protein